MVRTALLMAAAGTMIISAPQSAETRAQGPAGSAPVVVDGGAAAQLAQTDKPVVYRPPLRGAPTRRVGGATRGDERWDLVLAVLAPEQTALTADASPDLYWYLSKADSRPAVFALIRDDRIEPVVEVTLTGRPAGGIAKVALADIGVQLEPGVLYEWSVALVTDPDARSKDVVSSATLLRREPNADLRHDVEDADLSAKAALYAGAGYWYDAIGALSTGVAQGHDTSTFRAIRADLLDQVGLQDAAAFDRPH